ncbi:hypothetical protein AAC387_Pa05g2882 [Persea americana]
MEIGEQRTSSLKPWEAALFSPLLPEGGIGSRTAKLFSQHGAKVVIADLNEEIGQAVCKELGPQGASFIHCDVTKEDSVQNAVDAAVSKYGKLDIMFNNAGIVELPKPSIVETEKSDFERVLSINVIGVFLGTKHAARVMIPARRGSIINTSSTASRMGGITPHAYTSSKHAVVGLTINAAIELGQFGVRANCVAPHVVPTPMTTSVFKMGEEELAKRADSCSILKGISLKAEDIAEAALFLGSDESRLEGKVALITGGASGIGSCTAKLFSQHGAKVVIADLNEERGQAVCKELGPQVASFIRCDITKEDNVQNAVDATVSKYRKLDIMFNNAGIIEPLNPSIVETEKSDFERVLSTNVIGVFLGTKHAARVMIPARCGSIINTSSVASRMGGLAPHAYTSSKHAVVGLTRNAAIELGQFSIRVNCVAPYVVPTPLASSTFKMGEEEIAKRASNCSILKGVLLEAEDIALAALYLGSDESRYVNGHNLMVDGGYTLTNPTLIEALTS